MTEREARAKSCCGPVGSGQWVNNRRVCIGSECMAWVWLPHPDRIHASGGAGKGRMGITPIPGWFGSDVPDDEVTTTWEQTVPNREPRDGDCGLKR